MSNQPDRRNRPTSPPAARKPAPGAAKAPAPGPRPPSGGSRPPGSGSRPASGARTGKPTTSRPIAAPGKALRPLDLALITIGILVVGVLIWFGLGGFGGSPTANNSSSGLGSSPGSAPGEVGALLPVSATLEAIYSTYNVTPVPAGQAAPGFSLPAVDGNTYSLSDFKGKVVVLEFMAPWCPHCQEDAPIFNEIHQKYQGQDVQLLAVSASPFGRNYSETNSDLITMDDLSWFRDSFQVQIPMLFDPHVKTASAYGVTRFPTVFVVDKNGNLVTQLENPPTVEKVSAAVDQVLQGGGAAPAAGQ
jgi:peroxiredoxin